MPQLDLLFVVGGVQLRINPQGSYSRLQLESEFAELTKYFTVAMRATFGEEEPLPAVPPLAEILQNNKHEMPEALNQALGRAQKSLYPEFAAGGRIRVRAKHGATALLDGPTKQHFEQLLVHHLPHQILTLEGTEIDAWKFEDELQWRLLP